MQPNPSQSNAITTRVATIEVVMANMTNDQKRMLNALGFDSKVNTPRVSPLSKTPSGYSLF